MKVAQYVLMRGTHSNVGSLADYLIDRIPWTLTKLIANFRFVQQRPPVLPPFLLIKLFAAPKTVGATATIDAAWAVAGL
ncbi:hypothetical protein SZ25_00439 [Candidatus Arcanobacter lacustris]|uniref:Uncharacterized protein n=1 Tax=Candidatus Arcanibacter lacustris TaxID=1607817 RepID=A0A0F5MQY3_9RICK|nr:hypothetical protein SZ25_00439 [Candidatus Arcanobacter lacustris]